MHMKYEKRASTNHEARRKAVREGNALGLSSQEIADRYPEIFQGKKYLVNNTRQGCPELRTRRHGPHRISRRGGR